MALASCLVALSSNTIPPSSRMMRPPLMRLFMKKETRMRRKRSRKKVLPPKGRPKTERPRMAKAKTRKEKAMALELSTKIFSREVKLKKAVRKKKSLTSTERFAKVCER